MQTADGETKFIAHAEKSRAFLRKKVKKYAESAVRTRLLLNFERAILRT